MRTFLLALLMIGCTRPPAPSCPPAAPAPAPVVLAPPRPTSLPGVDPFDRFGLICLDDRRTYLAGRDGEMSVATFAGRDLPYYVCITTRRDGARVCKSLASYTWTIEVQAGDYIQLAIDATGTPAGFDAVPCPQGFPALTADWTSTVGQKPDVQLVLLFRPAKEGRRR